MSSPAPEEPYNDTNGGEFEDDELRLLGKLHIDQSKWLPSYSSSVPINAGTKMLHDVYWTHKDVVFYADMNLLMAFVSMALMIATKETYYRWFNPIMSAAGPTQDQYNVYMILLFSNSFATFLQIFAIFGFYRASIRVDQVNMRFLSYLRSVWLDQHLIPFFVEVFICIWHEPPFIQHWMEISLPLTERGLGGNPTTPVLCLNPWAVLVFFRIYLVLRYIQAHHYSAGVRIVGSWANFDFTTAFSLRDVLGAYPMYSLMFSGLFIIVAGGYSFYIMEREISYAKSSLLGAFWWAAITGWTIGYGDIYPATSAGRLVAVLTAGCGILWLAALTAAAYSNLILFPYESRMIEFLELENCKHNRRFYAAAVIQTAYRWYHSRIHGKYEQWKMMRKLKHYIHMFHNNDVRTATFTTTLLETQLFRWQIEKLEMKVADFMKCFREVHHIEQRFDTAARAKAATYAAKQLAKQLELKRQENEAEVVKKRAEEAAALRAREQKRALQDEREAAAEAVAKTIAKLEAPTPVIVDPIAIMKVPDNAPVVRWKGSTSEALTYKGPGVGPFEECTVADATAVLGVAHRPHSPIPPMKPALGALPSDPPVYCKRCLVCYYCRREAESMLVQSVHQCQSCVDDPTESPDPATPRDMKLAFDDSDDDQPAKSSKAASKPEASSHAALLRTLSRSGSAMLEPSKQASKSKSRGGGKGVPKSTAEVVGDAEQDNFMVLPEPNTHGRLERLLSTIQTHMTAILTNLALLQQRVDKSEATLSAAEKQLGRKREIIA